MFSPEEKAEIDSIIGIPFECFKEEITIYRTPTIAFVNSDAGFNFAYGAEQPSVNMTYQPQSGKFWATVEYLDNIQENELMFPDMNAPIQIAKSFVRISVQESGRAFLEGVEKIVIDGNSFAPASEARPRGMFSRNTFDYYFSRLP
jgi:hypothetical protein